MIDDSQISIAAVKPIMLDLVWPIVSPLIEKAIHHSNGELSVDTIKEQVLSGALLLLTVADGDGVIAALTLEKRNFPTGKTIVNIVTAGGSNMDIWMDKVLEAIEKVTEEMGCDELYIVGRAGWQKALQKKGFTVSHTVLTKKLGD